MLIFVNFHGFYNLIFFLTIFLPSLTIAQQALVIDSDSVGQTKCLQVLIDYKIYDEIKDQKYFPMDDFPKFDTLRTFEKYMEYYRGYELGVALATNSSINSTPTNSELAILIKMFCEQKPTQPLFTIIKDIESLK